MYVTYSYFKLGKLNGHLLGKEMFFRFPARVFERLSICVSRCFFPLVGGMRDFVALNPDCIVAFMYFLH